MHLKPTSRHINSKAGLGLVEVLVSVALIGITGLALTDMMMIMIKSQRSVKATDAMRELAMEIRSTLSDNLSCVNTFNGQNLTLGSVTVTTVRDGGNNIKYSSGVNYIGGLLKIKNLVLNSFVPDLNPNVGKAKLLIFADKTGEQIGSTTTYQILSVQLELDAAKNIIKCKTIGGGGESFWLSSTVSPNDIYYTLGNVGIGSNNPVHRLDVAGSIRASTIVTGGSAEFNSLSEVGNPGNSINFPGTGSMNLKTNSIDRIVINSSGAVGVGIGNPQAKLDVAGEIKIANSGSGCTGLNEGAVRYNQIGKKIEFCDGAGSWVTPGESVPPGTLCGSVSYDNVLGHNLNPIPCRGSVCGNTATLVDNCPSGYAMRRYFQADDNYAYTCVKM